MQGRETKEDETKTKQGNDAESDNGLFKRLSLRCVAKKKQDEFCRRGQACNARWAGGGWRVRLAALRCCEVDDALLDNITVLQGAVVLELLAPEDEALLSSGDAFLQLNARLDGSNGVSVRDLKCDCQARQQLDEYLHDGENE